MYLPVPTKNISEVDVGCSEVKGVLECLSKNILQASFRHPTTPYSMFLWGVLFQTTL